MVLGIRTKKSEEAFKIEYQILFKSITTWPPSPALRQIKDFSIHWKNGDRNYGNFNCNVGDEGVVSHEAFRIHTTLKKEASRKGSIFSKNVLEFSIYEDRKGKASRGQHLASALVDLADYGIIMSDQVISCPLIFKKPFRSVTPSVLLIVIKPSSSGVSVTDKDDGSEIASFTDDDVETSEKASLSNATSEDLSSDHYSKAVDHFPPQETSRQGLVTTPQEGETLSIADQRHVAARELEDETPRFTEQRNVMSRVQEDETLQYEVNAKERVYNAVPTLRFTEDKDEEKVLRKHPTMNASLQTRREKLKHLKSVQIQYSSLTNTSKTTKEDSSKEPNKTGERSSTENSTSKSNQNHVVEVESNPFEKSQSNSSQTVEVEVEKEKASLQERIATLEEELMEVAAIEVGLYAVIPEHGSSSTKVHSPATRLSRFYFASKNKSHASKAIITGFILVSKSCGNDVPRLTFWLSNAIALRTIVKRGRKEEALSSALEKVESWIFTRIIESLWWQILTPRMQWSAVRTKQNKRHNEENYAIELWKNAFKDACESLCPVRAAGHECGCLPFLPKLVMEQLVIRLDVAMFNAILRESDDEMPTDPISDPISDPRVLPSPAGKFSFGAGARLKNTVGSWCRWLTGLFGIDDNEKEDETDKNSNELPPKPFRLLHSLSDLMMLPFELLNDSASRKEVLSAFGSSVIRRVLRSFVPDEFNPNPRCDVVLGDMDSDDEEASEYPVAAQQVVYLPAAVAAVRRLVSSIGEKDTESGSSVEDAFEELDSAMFDSLIGFDVGACRENRRFLLLRQAWR